MSAIKKLVIANLEATKARLSEGRQWIGIKNLEAPDEVQPRAGIDKDWVSQLATFRREGSEFPPARVYQLPDGRLILAEGHHRRWALLGDNEADILCEIVDGTMEEAIVYAAGSNKSNGVKPMSPKDISKAVEILFGIESWWRKANSNICRHVGCSAGKVKMLRNSYAARHSKELPSILIERGNIQKAWRKSWSSRRNLEFSQRVDGHFVCSYRNKQYQCVSKDLLKEKMSQIFKEEDIKRDGLKPSKIWRKLRSSGLKPVNTKGFGLLHGEISAWAGYGIVATQCKFSETVDIVQAVGNLKLFTLAIGRLVANRQLDRTSTRSVVICYREMGPQQAIKLFEESGIEFMTPDELVASLGPVIPDEIKQEVSG